MNPNSPSLPLSISVNSTPTVSEMENLIHSPLVPQEPPSSLWDWSDLLDFTFNDDHFNFSLDSDQSPPLPPPLEQPPISEKPADSGRTRKRDPRLTCENFLAGRVPCACPEMDAAMEEEEELPGRKKKRMVRTPQATVRCQVPDCKADISELKGYHRRHRVCLRCANAKEVLLGQMKRYCQQCGKFHILSDFDEGKRSCRRKLERHNIRRRRKPSEPGISVEKETETLVLSDDLACDDDNGKDTTCLNSQIVEREPLLESEEGQASIRSSDPESQNAQSDDVLKFAASDETQVDLEKNRSESARSSVNFEKKLAYSSVCPTGRISFKLYDWNPAEFPRRLRHQIFQWLASMPVELEGYIRPGCTILTAFVAMPNFMWCKLLQEPVVYIADLVTGPEKMLSGRGSLLVYLDNMIFRVLRDGISVTPIKVEECAPRLHYVQPTCFEAGKPVEFVVCGNNLLQPKFRFLVSFCGKYLAYEYSVRSQQSCTEGVPAGFDYQLLKIYIPHTEPGLFGPAFVEVENQSGLSNFIPILIGSREICSEMKIMEQRFEGSLSSEGSKLGVSSHCSNSCEALSKQTYFSQFILDTAWLTRKPAVEDIKHTPLSFQIERFNRLFSILIENKSTVILERVLHYVEAMVNGMKTNCSGSDLGDTDMELLQRNMADAKQILSGTLNNDEGSWLQSRNIVHNEDCLRGTSHIPSVISSRDQENLELQDPEATEKKEPKTVLGSTSQDDSSRIPLLNEEVVMNMMLVEGAPTKSLSHAFTRKHFATRPLVLAIACVAVCLCVCAVFVHPQEVGKIMATIRSSLFENRLRSC